MHRKIRLPQEGTTNVPFILMVLVSGVLAYTRPDHITIDLFCVLMISIVLDTIHFFLTRGKIEVAIDLVAKKVQKAEALEVIIKAANNSLWPSPYLHILPKEGYRLTLKEKQNYCCFLGSYSSREIGLVYEAQLSGKQIVGLENVFIKDYLGLYKKQLTLPDNPEVRVLPEIRESIEVDEFLGGEIENGFSKKGGGLAKVRLEGEVTEELTAYKPGDSTKLLHWKIFAQKNQLLVRKRQTGEQMGESVLLILNPIGSKIEEEKRRYELQDKSLTTSLSLCYKLVEEGHQVAFMYYRKGSWIKASLKYVREIQYLREKLAGYEALESVRDKTYRGALSAFLKGIQKEEGMRVVVTEDLDEDLLSDLKAWSRKLTGIKLICVGGIVNKGTTLDIEAWHVNEAYKFGQL